MTNTQNTQSLTVEQQAERDAWDQALATPESQEFLKEASEKALQELEESENSAEGKDELQEL